MRKYRVIFMGTPDFALPSLEALAMHPEYEVVLVMCQPDRQQGRGMKIQAPPVKQLALKLGLEVFQPESLMKIEIQEHVLSYEPDFIVTAAYGLLLPQNIIQGAKIASFNLHASLLPKYRGSAPIQRAIFDGVKETGITSMMMVDELDAGDMLIQESIVIGEYENYGSVYTRLQELATDVMFKTTTAFINGEMQPKVQDKDKVSYAPAIERQDQEIDFTQSAIKIKDRIRGLDPLPGAIAYTQDKLIKIWQSEVIESSGLHGQPGQILKGDKDGFYIACGQGVLALLKVQPAGKKAMNFDVFLRGNPIEVGSFLKLSKRYN